MRTSEEVYHRVRWDQRFDPARFVLGVNVRGAAPARVPLAAFVPGGDIPWHRVLFIEADGVPVWDRAAGLDRLDSAGLGLARAPRRLRAPFFTARTPHAWDPAAAGWRPVTGVVPTAPGAPARLRVITWNTLWDRYDSERIHTARRRPLLLAALEHADADVIALQEVEPALVGLLLAAPWVRAGYAVDTDPTGPDVAGSGLLLLSRLPVAEAARHELGPHKAVAAVTVLTTGGPLVVATTHLSSDHSENGAGRRDAELARLSEGLDAVAGPLVLVGDFNDGTERPATALGLRDAWSEVHGPADRTPTFDPGANPLAAVASLSGRASRLDRILLRGADPYPAGAALLGERPAPDGLFASDHFGVVADLVGAAPGHGEDTGVHTGEEESAELLRGAPTARTALAWIPPAGLWPAIQQVRAAHDPQLDRWPPHVNLLFGFVPEADFDRAAELVARVAAEQPPFAAELGGVRSFAHRDDATLWLDPAAADPAPWAALHSALSARFPGCRGRAEGYTPHLTLGRAPDPQRLADRLATRLGREQVRVGELVLLSRRGEEPMRPRMTVALGTGEIHRLPEPTGDPTTAQAVTPAADPVGPVLDRLAAALPAAAVLHLAGSRRLGCELPGADLDLVAALPGAVDPAELRTRLATALPEAAVRQVTGARVPGLRLRIGTLAVDLVTVGTGQLPPAEAVARRAELGEAAATALGAVSDAQALADAVGAERAAFAGLAREVKAWARARGLDSAPFGGLPGLAWTVLAALTVRQAPGGESPEVLLHRFFGDWAAWDWRQPVALTPPGAEAPAATGLPVTVLTPTAPLRPCTDQVGPGGRDLLVRELYRAWELTDPAGPAQPGLLSPPPLHRRHAAWAVLRVRARAGEDFEVTRGRLRGRLRALLTALERAGCAEAHAWPRPVEAGPGSARYAVGLGRTPPDRARLAALAEGWLRTVPGTSVEWADGCAVPTLR
ncbi:poly(A) polymerase [Kitasatospora sp. NPDC094015]|uniref:poly(A) polymerase n=1 Tax=Kitasatospora sp. NPDC094015 TaxID=3155205 RepID=UPI00332CC0C2